MAQRIIELQSLITEDISSQYHEVSRLEFAAQTHVVLSFQSEQYSCTPAVIIQSSLAVLSTHFLFFFQRTHASEEHLKMIICPANFTLANLSR